MGAALLVPDRLWELVEPRPRCRPDCVVGDRTYDAEDIRHTMRARGILPLLAMRNTPHGSGLGQLALGCGTHFCMAESVRSSARAI